MTRCYETWTRRRDRTYTVWHQLPEAPVAPIGPAGPLAPLGPVSPIEPCSPVNPASPGRPEAPLAPVAPAHTHIHAHTHTHTHTHKTTVASVYSRPTYRLRYTKTLLHLLSYSGTDLFRRLICIAICPKLNPRPDPKFPKPNVIYFYYFRQGGYVLVVCMSVC